MPDRRIALLIGNSHYDDDQRLAALRCPTRDVTGLGAVLEDSNIGRFESVARLPNAIHVDMLERTQQMLQEASRDDLVLFYFSGHGLTDEQGRLYLAATNTRRHILQETSFPSERLKEWCDTYHATRVIVILDCCVFRMGDKDDRDGMGSGNELPHHDAPVEGFFIATHEVTNAGYLRCVEAGICTKAHYEDGTCLRVAEITLRCSHCGYDTETELHWSPVYEDRLRDRYFGFPLWLQLPCCGELLWAYNEAHLQFLKEYVAASLREREPRINSSLASRLLKWLKVAKHRHAVLQGIECLQQSLLSHRKAPHAL